MTETSRRLSLALALALPWACTSDPVTLTDGWSAAFTFRDPVSAGEGIIPPLDGWQMTPLHGHLLPDGRVLLHGEQKNSNDNAANALVLFNDATWVIDPADPRFRAKEDSDVIVQVRFPPAQSEENPWGTAWRFAAHDGQAFEGLECGGHTFLADGRLFVTGGGAKLPDDDPLRPPEPGKDGLVSVGVSKSATWAFDDEEGWRSAPPMQHGPRWYPTATRLADGRVLVSSGYYDTERLANPSVEVFDPETQAWTTLLDAPPPGDPLPAGDPRGLLTSHVDDYLHAFLLPHPLTSPQRRELAMIGVTGQVVFFGASHGEGIERLLVPSNGRRPGPASMRERMYGATSALLPDGRLLVAGGLGPLSQRVDVYDPRPHSPGFDTWSGFDLCDDTGTCSSRHHPSSVLLPDGRVALMSGHAVIDEGGDPRRPAYLDWERSTVRFGSAWPDPFVRGYHNVALLLPDARVLVVGGRNGTWTTCNGPDSSYCLDERTELRFYEPEYLSPALLPLRPRIEALLGEDGGSALASDRGNPVLGFGQRFTVKVEAPDKPRLTAVLLGLGSMTHSFDMNQRYVALESTQQDGTLSVVAPADGTSAPPGPYMLFVLRAASEATGHLAVPSVARLVWVR